MQPPLFIRLARARAFILGNSFFQHQLEKKNNREVAKSVTKTRQREIKSHAHAKKPPRLLLSPARFCSFRRRATAATDDGADQRASRECIYWVLGKKANSMRGFDSNVRGLGEERGVREEPGIHVRELLLRCDLFLSSCVWFVRFICLIALSASVFFSLSLSVSVIYVDARARRLTDDTVTCSNCLS